METMAKLSTQQDIRDNNVDLVTSYILVAENSANRFDSKRNDIQKFIDKYTYTYVSEDSSVKVKELAKDIMEGGHRHDEVKKYEYAFG